MCVPEHSDKYNKLLSSVNLNIKKPPLYMTESTRKDLVYLVSWSICHIEILDVGIYWSGNIKIYLINMNSCHQNQWKKITDLSNHATSLRLVVRFKTQVLISSWDLKGFTYWQSWWILLRTKRKTAGDDWVPATQPLSDQIQKSEDVHGKVLLHHEWWGRNYLNESFSLICGLRSGWFQIMQWQKKQVSLPVRAILPKNIF